MPLYDLKCANGHTEVDVWASYGTYTPCPTCGGDRQPDVQRRGAVLDDSFIGGKTFENLADTPVTFYSRTKYRQYLREHRIEEFVRHAPLPGSDKSPYTEKWGGIAPETLEGARLLLERVGLAKQTEPTYIADLRIDVSEEAGTILAPKGTLGGGHVA